MNISSADYHRYRRPQDSFDAAWTGHVDFMNAGAAGFAYRAGRFRIDHRDARYDARCQVIRVYHRGGLCVEQLIIIIWAPAAIGSTVKIQGR